MKSVESGVARAAAIVRQNIRCQLGSETGRIILTPSSLVALRLIFAALRVHRLTLTTEEYYTAAHFPGMQTSTLPFGKLSVEGRNTLVDRAVIASVVTWRGRRLDVQNVFSKLASSSRKPPILIADGSHLGAAGWPSIENLEADIVFGDPVRWLSGAVTKQNLGFVWLRSEALWKQLLPAFHVFYLATETPTLERQSRWIDPQLVRRLANWYSAERLTRKRLVLRHNKNASLAGKLAAELGVPVPETAIIWLQDQPRHRALRIFQNAGLVWTPDSGGTRIMCWADVLHGNKERNEDPMKRIR